MEVLSRIHTWTVNAMKRKATLDGAARRRMLPCVFNVLWTYADCWYMLNICKKMADNNNTCDSIVAGAQRRMQIDLSGITGRASLWTSHLSPIGLAGRWLAGEAAHGKSHGKSGKSSFFGYGCTLWDEVYFLNFQRAALNVHKTQF